jgi:hypothetical protein
VYVVHVASDAIHTYKYTAGWCNIDGRGKRKWAQKDIFHLAPPSRYQPWKYGKFISVIFPILLYFQIFYFPYNKVNLSSLSKFMALSKTDLAIFLPKKEDFTMLPTRDVEQKLIKFFIFLSFLPIPLFLPSFFLQISFSFCTSWGDHLLLNCSL